MIWFILGFILYVAIGSIVGIKYLDVTLEGKIDIFDVWFSAFVGIVWPVSIFMLLYYYLND